MISGRIPVIAAIFRAFYRIFMKEEDLHTKTASQVITRTWSAGGDIANVATHGLQHKTESTSQSWAHSQRAFSKCEYV